jgi:hypothetical protein
VIIGEGLIILHFCMIWLLDKDSPLTLICAVNTVSCTLNIAGTKAYHCIAAACIHEQEYKGTKLNGGKSIIPRGTKKKLSSDGKYSFPCLFLLFPCCHQ